MISRLLYENILLRMQTVTIGVFGKVVYKQKVDFSENNEYVIDVKSLNSNIYFLTITDNDGQVDKIEKIVINKK